MTTVRIPEGISLPRPYCIQGRESSSAPLKFIRMPEAQKVIRGEKDIEQIRVARASKNVS
jgi:hypothetical protein